MTQQGAAEAILQQALALLHTGRLAEARTQLQSGRLLHPGHAGIALAFADSLHAERRLPEASRAYKAALKLNEALADGWYGLGCAELAQKRFGGAADALQRAALLAPRSGAVVYNLGKSLFELGRVGEAVRNFRIAMNLDQAVAPLAKASLACIIPGDSGARHADVRQTREAWARSLGLSAKKAQVGRASTANSRALRIGYLSAFFGARNWMKPVFAVINRHDRQAFEIHMLCDDAPPSGGSGYADDPNDFVHDITGTSAERAAQIIADLELDVLVDLNGYSAQERLPVLMRKPARNIVGWFNMFATTGVQAFDWLVGDDIVVRRDEETFYGERIHRVPGTYLAFEILYPVPDLAPPPSVENGFLTFGCLGSHYKITEEVLDAWAAILRAARHTRLFIKNGALEDESVRNDLLERLTGRDVPADRISLSGRSEHYDFLDAYRYVDIALDTFPYNGGTTTTEALWQGVPVLTFYGDRWASRTSASLLSAAALDDWIRPDAQDYVRYAAMLGNSATAADMLAGLRLSMRQHLAQSGACDAERLCRDLEGFYQRICRRK